MCTSLVRAAPLPTYRRWWGTAFLMGIVGCIGDISGLSETVPCVSCPAWTDLVVESTGDAVVGDTLHLRAFARGATVLFDVAWAPARNARWQLADPAAARLLLPVVGSGDTTQWGRASLVLLRAGEVRTTVRWGSLTAEFVATVTQRPSSPATEPAAGQQASVRCSRRALSRLTAGRSASGIAMAECSSVDANALAAELGH